MLDLFQTETGCFVTKVNSKKFTIKVECCAGGLNCLVKIRIYSQRMGRHQVEVQRRSGDSLAFHHFYRLTSDHLNAHASLDDGVESDRADEEQLQPPKFLGAPLQGLDIASETSVAPLLDLIESSDNLQVQAEVVESLLQAAQQDHLAIQLCTPQAFLVFQNLLQLVCFSVVEPLSRLLCGLVLLPEAERNFADHGLLQNMIEKVWSDAAGQSTSKQLAQTVHCAITQHSSDLSLQASWSLRLALTEKLRDAASDFEADASSTQNLATVHYLQESLQMLQACY